MANVFVPSANDPAVFTSDKFPLIKDADGNTYRTVVKANVNGSIDVFSKGTGLLGSDQLLFQYSATRNSADFTEGIFKDKPVTAFNSFFRGTGSNGEQFLKDAKTKWYQEAPPNASARLAGLTGYQGIAATTQRRTQSTGAGGALTIQTSQGPLTVSPPTTGDPAPATATAPLTSTNKDINELTKLIESNKTEESTVKARLSAINERYPKDISTKQDTILFRLKEIIGRDFTGIDKETERKDANFTFGTKSLSQPFGSVVLPIQPSITDSNGVDWGNSTLDPLSAFAGRASLALQTSDQIIQEVGNQFKIAAKEFKTNYRSYASALNLYLAQEAIGAQGLFSRGTGAVLNPNLELLFNGPTLRPFNFTFRLSPRSESEATIVKKIIYFFKAGMASRRANTAVFLKAPYVFSIQYQTGTSEGLDSHKSLNRIKDCALLSCDVDYTPDGTYMTFNDGEKTMTSYQLTLRFSELDPVYNTDYVDGHPIGY